MPDPVHAWAAVAPDGTYDLSSIDRTETEAKQWAAMDFNRGVKNWEEAWDRAYRAGWRVVPVKIEVMEGQKDG